MRRLALTLARLIGLAFVMYGAWGFFGNLGAVITADSFDPVWAPWVIMGIFLIGLIASVTFLLSFDGPSRWRNRRARVLGWIGLMLLALLPSQLILFMLPLGLLGAFTLFLPIDAGSAQGRHLIRSD